MPRFLAAAIAVLIAGCGSSATDDRRATTRDAPSAAEAPSEGGGRTGSQAKPRPRLPALVNHGPRTERRVALTFDADMSEEMLADLRSGEQETWYDARIVRELRRTDTPATIFMTGLWAREYSGVVRKLARDPLFQLENHSYDHDAFKGPCFGLPVVESETRKREEIRDAAAEIERTAGSAPRFFRFPGGCHSKADLRLVRAAGETAIGWDVVSGDPSQPDADVVVENVLDGVRPGSIVVMHLNGAPNAPATSEALPRIIPALKERGFRFVTLDELLADCERSGPAACRGGGAPPSG